MNHFCVSMFKHFDKSSTPTKKRYLAFWLNFLYLIFIAFLLSFHQNIDTSWNSECTLYKIVSLVVSNSKKCRKMSTRKLDSANQATLILGQNIYLWIKESVLDISVERWLMWWMVSPIFSSFGEPSLSSWLLFFSHLYSQRLELQKQSMNIININRW